MPGAREIIAALVTAPVRENLRHGDAAPELRTEFAVDGRQDVFRPHRRADADMRGLVSQGRRIGAELPGALQIHRLVVEHAHARHRLIHFHDFVRVLGEPRQRGHEEPFGIEDLPVVDFEFGDACHCRIMP